jgi:hypothetical protein
LLPEIMLRTKMVANIFFNLAGDVVQPKGRARKGKVTTLVCPFGVLC